MSRAEPRQMQFQPLSLPLKSETEPLVETQASIFQSPLPSLLDLNRSPLLSLYAQMMMLMMKTASTRRQAPLDLKLPSFLFFLFSLFVLQLPTIPTHALNVGIQSTDTSISVSKECSRKCESEFCSVPPFLRYGKYCGLLYSGCPGEKPCDGLDSCCQTHDACVQAKNNDYLSQECNQAFLNCISHFKDSGRPSFKGNKCSVTEVVDIISVVIEAALVAGRVLHKP